MTCTCGSWLCSVWVSANAVSSCGVLLCRWNKHNLGLHRSSQVSVHLSTCDCMLCTGCKMILLTLNQLTSTIVALPSNDSKWQMGFNSAFKGLILLFPRNAQYIYILRIFASYRTVSRFHTYKYYSFVVQIQ